MIATQQIGVNEKGERTGENRVSYVLKYDGKKYPANVDRPSNEGIIWKLVNPRRVEFEHWSLEEKVTSSYVRTVTDDGQEMTQTTKYPTRECIDVQVFDRKPDAPRQLLAGAGLPPSAASPSGQTIQPPNPKDLTQGTWELNLQKTKLCPDNMATPHAACWRPRGSRKSGSG